MNSAHDPLTSDAVDLLLSAELDGDLDAAARELGLSASEAVARLDATPGVESRRLALTRARDLMAVPAPLEAGVVDRLVAGALAGDSLAVARERHARRDRRASQWRVLVAAGSVAAAIALVVGVASMQGNSNASKSALATAPKTEAHAAKAPSPVGANATPPRAIDFGDVTSPASLATRASALLHGGPVEYTDPNAVTDTTAQSKSARPSTTVTNAPQRGLGGDSGTFDAAGRPQCTAFVLRRYGIRLQPVVDGTGVVSGRPVQVLVFDGNTPVAYIVSAGDCSLVRKQPLS